MNKQQFIPKVGDFLWAKWVYNSPLETVLGPLICQRSVVVTAVDDDGITVMPAEPKEMIKFPYGEMEYPTARTDDGTIIRLLPQ